MKKRILFVDNEQNILDGLQRLLHPMRAEWDMVFVRSGQEALEVLDQSPFDVVVSDMLMPAMDGCQLLTSIRNRHPHIIRILLSGYSNQETIVKSLRVAHQYLSKPCDPETLKSTVARAVALRGLLSNEAVVGVATKVGMLPSAPSVYHEVISELGSANVSMHRLAEIVSKDLGITAKLLQMTNSTFFGLPYKVNNLERALTLLGLQAFLALTVAVQVFADHECAAGPGFSISSLWEHSLATAVAAKAVATAQMESKSNIDDAFIGGLLHDVGQLVLAANLKESYLEIMELKLRTSCDTVVAERKVLGITHAEVGAYLMGLWGLPDPIVEAIAFHHVPAACPGRAFSPLTAVHVGNVLAQKPRFSDGSKNDEDRLDLNYLAELGLGECIAKWEKAYGDISMKGGRYGG